MFEITRKDWDKIIQFAKLAYYGAPGDKKSNGVDKCEISGMLVAVKSDEGFLLKDPVILKQEVSASNCTIDKKALSDYYVKMAMEHGTDVRFVWWHSHHTMKAFWSATDIAAMEEFNGGDFSMSLVVNLKEEYKFRVNWWKPTENHIDTELHIIGDNTVDSKMIKDFKSLVSKETVKYRKGNNVTHYGYNRKQTSLLNDTNDYMRTYKQPGNYGPGYVDAMLMDTPKSILEKYIELGDKILDDVFHNELGWKDFQEIWQTFTNAAEVENIEVKKISKKDFECVKGGVFVYSIDYIDYKDGKKDEHEVSSNLQFFP